jgi:glycine/D-amino acid oxidase-like deaminating enzyme
MTSVSQSRSAPPRAGAARTEDLIIIGGGVMGLFCAYHASERFDRIVLLESGRIGDPMTASFGRSRSYYCGFLDPVYAGLAREALHLWDEFEWRTGVEALVRCGCANLAKSSITPELSQTYAVRTHAVLSDLGLPTAAYDGAAVHQQYPVLDVDLMRVDVDAGLVDLRSVTATLRSTLARRGVEVREEVETIAIRRERGGGIRVASRDDSWAARSLVLTAGHGTNSVLSLMEGARLQVPITKDRPSEARYYAPSPERRASYTAPHMPVLAYMDVGAYCHPIVEGVSDRVKIGYYHPPDLPRADTAIDGVESFVRECLPDLVGAPSEPVTDTDGCDYDLVADDNFVLGPIPEFPGAYVGVGWRGTGYKFSPWVGRVLSELAVRQGTVYDIARFDPERFESTAPAGR